MNKIIQWFKQLDKTKKIVILFITISFVSIFGIGIYNESRIMPIDDVVQTEETDKKEDKEEKEDTPQSKEEESNQIDVENNESNVVEESVQQQEKKPTTPSNTQSNESTNSTKNEVSEQVTKPQNNVAQENPKPVEKELEEVIENAINVSVVIRGIDNVIAQETIQISNGQNAYDALEKICKKKGVPFESELSMYGLYVTSVSNLMAKRDGTGWMYSVNGVEPNYAADKYKLKEGDSVDWHFVK